MTYFLSDRKEDTKISPMGKEKKSSDFGAESVNKILNSRRFFNMLMHRQVLVDFEEKYLVLITDCIMQPFKAKVKRKSQGEGLKYAGDNVKERG